MKEDILGKELDIRDYPVLNALTEGMGKLFALAQKHGYKELEDGYISKCHLCVDIRKHLVSKTDEYKELAPKEFYEHIGGE